MKTLEIQIKLPDEVSEEILAPTRAKAKKTAIISLWKSGVISTRWAAKALEVTYYDFLDLLAEAGVPIVRKGPNSATVEENLCKFVTVAEVARLQGRTSEILEVSEV